jgi:hypothetical protein
MLLPQIQPLKIIGRKQVSIGVPTAETEIGRGRSRLNFLRFGVTKGRAGKIRLVAVLQHSWRWQSDTMTGPDCTVGIWAGVTAFF